MTWWQWAAVVVSGLGYVVIELWVEERERIERIYRGR